MKKYVSIDEFIDNQLPEYQSLIEAIRQIILSSHPKMKEQLKFYMPMFSVKNVICYIGIIKAKKGVELGFHRGKELSNEHGLLDNKNRTHISGITFFSINDLNEKEEIFREIIQEAIILDEIHEKSVFTEVLQSGRSKRLHSK